VRSAARRFADAARRVRVFDEAEWVSGVISIRATR
jgi:hypothetical protein